MFTSHFRKQAFSTYKKANIPVIDFTPLLNNQISSSQIAHHFFNTLQEYRCVFVRDPRFRPQKHATFKQELIKYFDHRIQLLSSGKTATEVLRDQGSISGLLPRGIEASPDFNAARGELLIDNKPKSEGSVTEAVTRFRYPIGDAEKPKIPPQNSERFPSHIEKIVFFDKLVPPDFPHVADLMEDFGGTVVDIMTTCAALCDEALNWKDGYLSKALAEGVKIAAPGGADMRNLKTSDVICSFHIDYILLAGHAAPNFGGFLTWTDNGEKYEVDFPEDCIFIQTGYTLEYLTGGLLKAGFHEIEYTDTVAQEVEEAKKKGDSLLRLNSTIFAGINPYQIMEPHISLKTQEAISKYPPIPAVDYTIDYLKGLGLISKDVVK